MLSNKKKIVITIRGGLVDSVYCTDKEFVVEVLDFDANELPDDDDVEVTDELVAEKTKGMTDLTAAEVFDDWYCQSCQHEDTEDAFIADTPEQPHVCPECGSLDVFFKTEQEDKVLLTREDWTRINWLDRNKIVQALEGVSIACYDHESTQELKDALIANIKDGTISLDSLPE